MAKIQVQATGGQIKQIEATTVEQARSALGLSEKYTATVNGEPENPDYALSDYEFVTFTESVKGA